MELIIAIVSAVVALLSAAIAFRGQQSSTRLAAELDMIRVVEERRVEAERIVSRYCEPLARAAYDLQSRLFNILERHLISAYVEDGDERERSYVVSNTVFLIAQYFAWTEIIRKDTQFIDLGEDIQTRELVRSRDAIDRAWQTDKYGSPFRVFAGEQRAIGERIAREGPRGLECMGYAAFLDYIASQEDLLLDALRADVLRLNTTFAAARPRLVALQRALIDLLDFLDPDCIRFSEDRRTRVS